MACCRQVCSEVRKVQERAENRRSAYHTFFEGAKGKIRLGLLHTGPLTSSPVHIPDHLSLPRICDISSRLYARSVVVRMFPVEQISRR